MAALWVDARKTVGSAVNQAGYWWRRIALSNIMHFVLTIALVLIDLMMAPSLRHLERFPFLTRPQWSVINGMNCQQQVHLWNIANLYHTRHDLKELAGGLEKRRQAWDALDNARNSIDINHRRSELARLLRLIGDDAFLAGRMPAPYWVQP